jgi:RNA polymerase sigma factor (sigma-70 family)
MLGMCEAFQQIHKLKDGNLTGFVIARARDYIHRFLRRDHIVRIPYNAFKEGFIYLPLYIPVHAFTHIEEGVIIETEAEWDRPHENGHGSEDDLMSLLKLTEREKRILEMRMEGYTTREIGKEVGLSHVSVSNILADLKQRCIRLGVKR